MSIKKPLFTQMPNCVLDTLPSFSDPELRVLFAAIRNTIGFHRDRQPMSITWFVKKTGLSRPAVIKARNNLLDRDFLIEEEDRGKHGVKLYSVKWQQDTDSEDTPLVNDVDQSLVNGVYPLKESSKEKKKKKKDSSHPEGVAINGEKPIETTNNAGAGAYTDTPKPVSLR